MAKKTKKFLKDVAKMYGKKGGNISATCSAIDIDRSTFNKWRDEEPWFAQLLEDTLEAQKDWGESKLIEAIDKGDISSLHFFLRTKCGSRGYDPAQVVKVTGEVKASISDTEVKKAISSFAQMLKVAGIEPTEENINLELEKLKEKDVQKSDPNA